MALAAQAPGWADPGGPAAPAPQDGTGGDSTFTPYTPPASALPGIEAKEAAAQAALQWLADDSGGGSTASPDMCTPGDPCSGYPSAYTAVGWGFTLHKEGGGNPCTPGTTGCTSIGHKTYTCAAASTRNMVQAMTGTDYGEYWFETREHISPSIGLPNIDYIADVLNNNFGGYGGWTVYEPTDADELISKVMSDTYMFNQGVIQNVDTSWLAFWNGHQTEHFDVVYGYTNYGADVKIAEEWDPQFTFGYSVPYGDPYGKHTQQVTISGHTGEFEAVHKSPTERMVV